jgi:uncharacterized UPF0146 family protein
MRLNFGGAESYFSDFFVGTECSLTISATNSCNDVLYAWENGDPLEIGLIEVQQMVPRVETTTEKKYSSTGAIETKVTQVVKYGIGFVQPKSYANILHGIKGLDTIELNGQPIRNIEVEVSDVNQFYSSIRFIYEFYNPIDGNNCCPEIDIDKINLGEGEIDDEECNTWQIEIEKSGNTLTVVSTDQPEGTPTYRWYRNGSFLTSATSITVTLPGNYRVDVSIGGCKKTAAYFIEDECALLNVRVYRVDNVIMADINGVQEDCEPPTVTIYKDDVAVGSAVPYEALESGNYVVKVESCDCERSNGIKILIEDCDFDASLAVDGNLLTVTENSGHGSFEWEYEDQTGRSGIGSGTSVNLNKTGIYWVTITVGECERELYYYHVAEGACLPISICNWDEMPVRNPLQDRFMYETGDEFTLVNINLDNVNNFDTQLQVLRNGNNSVEYVAGTPTEPYQYTVGAGNKIILSPDFPLDNENLIINFKYI